MLYIGKCFFCGKDKATVLCEKCHDEFGAKNRMAFCDSCFDIGHTHKRTEHEKEQIGTDADLELLSVLCIETSHYVCFTKSNKQWLFFDSMFDRKCKLTSRYNVGVLHQNSGKCRSIISVALHII